MNWRYCFAPWRIVEWIHWTNWTMSSRKLGLLAMQWIVMKCVVNPALDPIKPREFLRIQNVAYGVLWVTCELMSRNLRIGTRVLIFNFISPVPIRNPFLFVSGQQLSFTVLFESICLDFHSMPSDSDSSDVRPKMSDLRQMRGSSVSAHRWVRPVRNGRQWDGRGTAGLQACTCHAVAAPLQYEHVWTIYCT